MNLLGASPHLNRHWDLQNRQDAKSTSSSSLFFMAMRIEWSALTGCISSLDLTMPSRPIAETVPWTIRISPLWSMETHLSALGMSRSSQSTLFTASL